MDPEVVQVFNFLIKILPLVVIIVALGVGGSLLHTWLRIKNGYPLQNSWGMPIHPKTDQESVERIKLLTGENAQLRAELGSVKDRLETLERIATDQPAKLAREIDELGAPTLGGSDMHDSPTVVLLAMIIVGLPTVMLMLIFNRFFKLREKKLDVEAGMAAEKAAQYAARTHELEDRVRVLEQIVTDRGVQTAAQIEALRVHTTDRPRKSSARTAG